jgi:hypothetical protein
MKTRGERAVSLSRVIGEVADAERLAGRAHVAFFRSSTWTAARRVTGGVTSQSSQSPTTHMMNAPRALML